MGNWPLTMTHLSLAGPLSILALKETRAMGSPSLSVCLGQRQSRLSWEVSGRQSWQWAGVLVGASYSLPCACARPSCHPLYRSLIVKLAAVGRRSRTELDRVLGCLGLPLGHHTGPFCCISSGLRFPCCFVVALKGPVSFSLGSSAVPRRDPGLSQSSLSCAGWGCTRKA